ncbi:MAG: S-methyl-5'-thioadenosine phosphorylase [Myxococcaceae bacterium]
MRVGIIGGSGLDSALGTLGQGDRVEVETPFGPPAGAILMTEINGLPAALLARHGPGHAFNPSQVPYRANLFALKKLGVTHVIATGAVGSLREEIAPRELVVVDQLIDRTFRRESTFFDHFAVHTELAQPFCPVLRQSLLEASRAGEIRAHEKGTYICMEGPQFSTKAESEANRAMGGDVIGMTACPEAKLAREASLCYALVALPTDYDCWRPTPSGKSSHSLLEEIIGNLNVATQNGLELIKRTVSLLKANPECHCRDSLERAVWTDPKKISKEERARLAPLVSKVLPEPTE